MRFGKLRNKGAAIILVAGITLGFLLLFAVLAIDFSRMYYVRGELQNAADSAALAGVSLLLNSSDLVQDSARKEAIKFALKNKAAGTDVTVVTDNTNELKDGNDITVGYWDGTAYTRGGTPVNAIEVRPQRAAGLEAARGPVGFLFPRLIPGLESMGVKRVAVAFKGPPFVGAFPICLPSCSIDTPLDGQWDYDKNKLEPVLCTDADGTPPGQLFLFESSSQASEPKKPGMAWTNFFIVDCPTSINCDMPDPGEILPYLQGKQPPDICNKYICTTNGTMANLFDYVETMFNKNKKEYKFRIGATFISVTGWQIFIPVVSNLSCSGPKQTCPGAQEGKANPYLVQSYAKVLVTEVVKPRGLRLVGFANPRTLDETFTCKGGGKPETITVNRKITSLSCSDCSEPLPDDEGSKGKLVR